MFSIAYGIDVTYGRFVSPCLSCFRFLSLSQFCQVFALIHIGVLSLHASLFSFSLPILLRLRLNTYWRFVSPCLSFFFLPIHICSHLRFHLDARFPDVRPVNPTTKFAIITQALSTSSLHKCVGSNIKR